MDMLQMIVVLVLFIRLQHLVKMIIEFVLQTKLLLANLIYPARLIRVETLLMKSRTMPEWESKKRINQFKKIWKLAEDWFVKRKFLIATHFAGGNLNLIFVFILDQILLWFIKPFLVGLLKLVQLLIDYWKILIKLIGFLLI